MTETCRQLRKSDYVLLTLLAAAFFGYATVNGKPLTMHEARLPQTSREMMDTGRWLLPHSGERPWLERPPFPHCVTLAVGHVAGRLDAEWIVRIPPVLMGWATLLLVGWMAARLLGRQLGLLSAVTLATMYEFYFYAGQAEDDIFLALLVALTMAFFVATEFPRDGQPDTRRHFVGSRPLTVWLFFIVLGATSLAKGPLVGAVEVLAAVGAFLLLTRDRTRILRYVWLWGWLGFAAVLLSWYVYAYSVYPSIWDNLLWDFSGQGGFTKPFWYYAVNILWTTAPWTPFWVLGLVLTWRAAKADRTSPHRFLWCWALVPLLVMSIAARKHHHYLVPVLAPFAVLAAIGLVQVGKWLFAIKRPPGTVFRGVTFIGAPGAVALVLLGVWGVIPGPLWVVVFMAAVFLAAVALVSHGLARHDGLLVLVPQLVALAIVFAYGQSVVASTGKNAYPNAEFLLRVGQRQTDTPIFVDARDSLEFFRIQYYLPVDAATPMQDITFLRDERITAPRVYVIMGYSKRDTLAAFGQWKIVDESRQAKGNGLKDDRYVLYEVTFNPDLQRYPAPAVSVTQAMGRAPGPFCGPPVEPSIITTTGKPPL